MKKIKWDNEEVFLSEDLKLAMTINLTNQLENNKKGNWE